MKKINYLIKFLLYKIYCIFPIKKGKIVCNNFLGKGFGDNPKYICYELNKDIYDVVWACKEEYNDTLPDFIRPSNRWYRYLYEFATANVWISNVRLPKYIKKRKGQYYIQTWHGGVGLKKVENDATQSLSKDYIESAKKDSKQTDLMLVNSEFFKKIFQKAFWYDGEMLCEGLPRNDWVVSKDYIINQDVKKDFNLEGYNIILYAPTFRLNTNKNVYDIDLNKCIELLNEKTDKKWKALVKLHPNILNSNELFDFNENVINVSYVSDINDLFCITDILISDYSSLMFDFMTNKKPIYIYANDIEEYKRERDFYIEIEDLPFKICENNNEIFKEIVNYKKYNYKKIEDFYLKYGIIESGKVSKKIEKIIKKKVVK